MVACLVCVRFKRSLMSNFLSFPQMDRSWTQQHSFIFFSSLFLSFKGTQALVMWVHFAVHFVMEFYRKVKVKLFVLSSALKEVLKINKVNLKYLQSCKNSHKRCTQHHFEMDNFEVGISHVKFTQENLLFLHTLHICNSRSHSGKRFYMKFKWYVHP